MEVLLRNDFLNHLSSHVEQKSTDIQIKTLRVKGNQVPRLIHAGDKKDGPSSLSPNKVVIYGEWPKFLTSQQLVT